ncbi:MAG: hypothetical protein M5U19_05385 [Microthrixaceae bacterium]|nr:hypothetical protein [Microthrixaceae bacterium]
MTGHEDKWATTVTFFVVVTRDEVVMASCFSEAMGYLYRIMPEREIVAAQPEVFEFIECDTDLLLTRRWTAEWEGKALTWVPSISPPPIV